jgi:hypothetical protein
VSHPDPLLPRGEGVKPERKNADYRPRSTRKRVKIVEP